MHSNLLLFISLLKLHDLRHLVCVSFCMISDKRDYFGTVSVQICSDTGKSWTNPIMPKSLGKNIKFYHFGCKTWSWTLISLIIWDTMISGTLKLRKISRNFPLLSSNTSPNLLYHWVDSEANYQQLLKQHFLKTKTSRSDSYDVLHFPENTVVSVAKWFWYPEGTRIRQICDIKALWMREDPKRLSPLSPPLYIFVNKTHFSLWICFCFFPSRRSIKSLSWTSEL